MNRKEIGNQQKLVPLNLNESRVYRVLIGSILHGNIYMHLWSDFLDSDFFHGSWECNFMDLLHKI